jgi:hypothetical protein
LEGAVEEGLEEVLGLAGHSADLPPFLVSGTFLRNAGF